MTVQKDILPLQIDCLPRDIQIKICEMNPEHRELFSKVSEDVEISGSHSRMKSLTNIYNSDMVNDGRGNGYFGNYLVELLDDPDKVMKGLSKCKCCVRHQKCRPKSLFDPADYDPNLEGVSRTLFENSENQCQCSCRHHCRFIFNTFAYEPDFLIEDAFNHEDEGIFIS